jgi:hypothetical protein
MPVLFYPSLKVDKGLAPRRIRLLQNKDLTVFLDRNRVRHHIPAFPPAGIGDGRLRLGCGGQPGEFLSLFLANLIRINYMGSPTSRIDRSAKFTQGCFQGCVLAAGMHSGSAAAP